MTDVSQRAELSQHLGSASRHLASAVRKILTMPSLAKTAWSWALYVACLLLFLELSLQLFYRFTTGTYLYAREKPALWASDPYSLWTNRPDLTLRHLTPEFSAEIYTNSEGFRVSSAHEGYQKQRPNNTFRILLVGPSFAFGWGVNFEATFGAQLQQILTARHFADPSKVEVLNHGVPGLPPANELEWLKQVGMQYAPNLVIHFAYGSLETSSKPKTDVVVRDGLLILTDLNMRELVQGYAKHSATVFYTAIIITKLIGVFSIDALPRKIEGAGRDMRNSPPFSEQDPVVSDSLVFYEALRKTVNGAGAELLVVYFPLSYVVHPEDRARWALQSVEHIADPVQVSEAFSSYLNRIGIRTLNLTGSFLQIANTEKKRLYYWLDVHWTEFGNMMAARLVADDLIARCAKCVNEKE